MPAMGLGEEDIRVRSGHGHEVGIRGDIHLKSRKSTKESGRLRVMMIVRARALL